MRRAATARCLVLLASLGLAASCRDPTEITIVVSTDIPCAQLRGSSITVGLLHAIETQPTTTSSTSCDASGALGALVVVPSGAKGDTVAFKVVGGLGRDVLTCAPPYGKGCIVARRAIRFVPYTPLRLNVPLHASCDGVSCGETETCVSGACVTAQIGDPGACEGDGCGEAVLGPSQPDGGAGGSDGGSPEGGGDGASVDAPVADGARQDASALGYSDMTQAANWSVFDVGTLGPRGGYFQGATFDGRYVHFVPYLNGSSGFQSVAARYDTTSAFGSVASWSTFDVKSLGAGGFFGGAFDGRYVYMVPYFTGGNATGIAARYDMRAPFDVANSWSTFDVSTINAGAVFLRGATFDGRYVYMGGSGSIFARYDTQAGFTVGDSWSAINLSDVNPGAKGFVGAVFDGRYVYLVPTNNGTIDGLVPRYDTRAGFNTVASWSTFDVTTVHPNAKGFAGAAFDGRYIYLVPDYVGGGVYSGLVARYDTRADFATGASWSTFDVTTVNPSAKGFFGGAFDGRYIYLVPFSNGNYDGVVARYDIQGVFTAASAWSTFDVSTVNPNAKGFTGAVFDGRYLYLAPASGGIVARFDAKSPPAMPQLPAFSGSFL
jgi:hypothetical protein